MTALCERMQNSLGLTSAPGLPPLARAAADGAHADDEHVLVADLGGRAALLAALMADVLREPQPSTATNAAPPSGARRP